MQAAIGSLVTAVAFDTGQYGGLYVDADTKRQLLADGVIRPTKEQPERVDLVTVSLGHEFKASVPAVELSTDGFPAAKPLGLTEPILSLG